MELFVPEIIRRKRDGGKLTEGEIEALIRGYSNGKVADYQMSAMLMAVLFQGLDKQELGAWTRAMLRSGEVLDLADLPGTKVDKHSTGGVGDKISLCLAPAVAALGVSVPMISGRGLGHTGGTLDKLESIPGFKIDRSTEQAKSLLEKHGLFLIGQTAKLAPADRKIYGLRDVTGTVESIPLIASSIMSKKLAEGIDALVLDVKAGAGAFMTDVEKAEELARTLIEIGETAGKKVRALITRMDEPLGLAVGNSLEVIEAVDVMKGNGPYDVTELTCELGAEMLVLGGAASDLEQGRTMMKKALTDGSALCKFADIIQAQEGDPSVCDNSEKLGRAAEQVPVNAPDDGFVSGIHPRRVAMAALEVGAGRRTKEDAVDHTAGVVLQVKQGDRVSRGQPMVILHHNGSGADRALTILKTAFEFSKEPPARRQLVLERM